MNRMKLKHLTEFILFVLIAALLLCMNTYLFRNNDWDRQHVNAIKDEKNLDVVCVGGSSTFRYWEPSLAWNEFGITSYDYATAANRPAIMKGLVRGAAEEAHPGLLVIDMRCYVNAPDEPSLKEDEGGLRRFTDSLDLNLLRLSTVNDVMKYYDGFHDKDADPWSYYFDIAKYHDNYDRLGEEDNWKHLDNRHFTSPNKGFEYLDDHVFLNSLGDISTSGTGKLGSQSEKSLYELLDYIKENDLNVMFVASPYLITKDQEEKYNRAGQIVSSYGYRFLNANDYYDEMDLDFSRDFYDQNHVNQYGAEKYTRFVGDYICSHYKMPDHRSDPDYKKSWNKLHESAAEKDASAKTRIDAAIEQQKNLHELGERLKEETDFFTWKTSVENSDFAVFCVSKGNVPEAGTKYPWNMTSGQENIIRVYNGSVSVYESDGSPGEDYSGELGVHLIPFTLNSGSKAKMTISDTDIPISGDGLYIALYEVAYDEVSDAVCIGEDGSFHHIGL